MAQLARHPALPCSRLELPQPCAAQPPWQAREEEALLADTARQLLGSPAFLRRSGSSLAALLNWPLATAEGSSGLLQHYPALQGLAVLHSPTAGCSRAGVPSLGRPPPSLRRLTLSLPAGGVLRHVALPPRLQHCELVASSDPCKGGSHCHVAPEGCGSGGGFWSTCASLQLTVATGGLLLALERCQALRSCTALRVVVLPMRGGSPGAASGAAVARPAGAGLARWLQALAPLFAATPLQLFVLDAAAASLHTAADSSQPLLLVGSGPSCWQPAALTAAAAPAGSVERGCWGGLAAELRHDAARFLLRVRRCTRLCVQVMLSLS